ncbi:MAG: response regulator transcription factor [Treponema sp.]|jgi:DNA-binding NarL/FixJ family response regulator|nr:response regulator transcription factor [Treponema sp.]
MVRLVIAMKWENELNHTAITLDASKDFSVIGAVSDSYRVLKMIESEQPDIVILDYYLDQFLSLDLIPIIKHRSPSTSVIVISPYDDENHAWHALNKGVSGYIVRKFDMDMLAGIVHMVHTGGLYVSSQIIVQMLPKFHRYQELYQGVKPAKNKKNAADPANLTCFSPSEQRLIKAIIQGKTTKEIAEILNLKTGTVRNYISKIMKKTKCLDRTQLIYFVRRNGFFT